MRLMKRLNILKKILKENSNHILTFGIGMDYTTFALLRKFEQLDIPSSIMLRYCHYYGE